jgi:hypothetical protein
MDASILLSIAPKIAGFLIVFLGIGFAVEYFYLRRKKTPKTLTPETVPPIPQENAGTAKFATNYKAAVATNNVKKTKNYLVLAGGAVLVLVILVSAFIATRPQLHPTKNKAAEFVQVVPIGNYPNVKHTSPLTAGATFNYTGTPGEGNIHIRLHVQKFHCRDGQYPDPGTCGGEKIGDSYMDGDLPRQAGASITLKDDLEMSDCGAYQIDTDAEIDGAGEPAGSGLGIVSACVVPTNPPRNTPIPTTPPLATNTPVPSSIPTPTDIPNTYRITGRLYKFCSENPDINACPATGSTMNGVTVQAKLNGQVIATEVTHDYQGAAGAFLFNNLNAGTYSICTTAPAGSQFFCATGPENGTCFNQTVPPSSSFNVVLLKQTTSCTGPTSTPANTPIPTATLTPPPGSTSTPIPTRTPTPPPGSTSTPVPTATGTPVPTATPTVTPTPPPGSTNTPIPSPTQYIVVNVTNTPAASSPAPTIPSAGSPLPAIAVGIPIILMLLAFLL